MTKLLDRIEVTLRSFYIFNSTFGLKEDEEHKKILYYHPTDIELNTKIKDVGLSEAIITFTGTFTSDKDCKALHTQKTTQLFYQAESGFWMVLVLNVPKEIKLKDGIEVAEYRGGDVSDNIYSAVLKHCYEMFRLFAGTFQFNMDAACTDNEDAQRLHLCNRLQLFYDKYLQALSLPNCDFMDLVHSIEYLALDKTLFLRAHNFINMLANTFELIDETILLYNEQIICSGQLNVEELYCLHEHVVGNMLNKTRLNELDGAVQTNTNSSGDLCANGAFITEPAVKDDETTTFSETPAIVFLKLGAILDKYKLIIYRLLNLTLCIFVHDKNEIDGKFYDKLHLFMAPKLVTLAHDIHESLSRQIHANSCVADVTDSSTGTPKYLFINEQSLKHHTNICAERGKRVKSTIDNIPRNVINLMANLANKTNNAIVNTKELQVKTTNDFWIVKRHCNWREYYVILFNSKATLLDVTQEAKRIFEQELTDDVFFDK